jgi:surface protein
MIQMFRGSNFNQDISGWNVSSVIQMDGMFQNNSSINIDLSSWDVSNVTSCWGFSTTPRNTWVLPQPNFTNCNPR